MWSEGKSKSERQACHFVTFNTVDCVDMFIRPVYKQVIVHTLNHFIESKGLKVYSWCLMTNHLHLLAEASEGHRLEDIEQPFKVFTTQKLIAAIDTESETRKDWILKRLESFDIDPQALKQYNIWQNRNNRGVVDMSSPDKTAEYFQYVHESPVRERFVDHAPDYIYSSARDYAGSKGLVNIVKFPGMEQLLSVSETFAGSFIAKHARN